LSGDGGTTMAKLFLSYSRKDEAKARRFTEWLEREGHDVWRDNEDIGGGASFSLEIERALKGSGAVLVLWSVESVQSAWVRDEAGYGRDAGKLIPFSLDGTEPPLGFRQFQSIGLSRWKRHREPQDAERIRQAIARVTDAQEAEPASRPPASRHPPKKRFSRLLLAGAAIALLAAAASAPFLWQHWSNDQQITIAVLPSPQSSDRAMAIDYANVAAADMAAFLPRRFDRATVTAATDSSGAPSGYRMMISTNPNGAGANASLTLTDQDGHTTLWSRNWSVADPLGADLKAEVSAAASKAALCLTDAKGGSRRLSQPALGLYLSGCTGLGDTKLSDVDFETIFERVTNLAPDFAPGWANLALSRANYATDLRDGSPTAFAAAVQNARQAIAVARKMDPKSALPYHAEYHLIYNDDLRALQVLNKAAELDPDDGLIQMHISDELMSVGRISDSVKIAERAVALEPGAPYARSQYILSLIYSGQFSKAKADIAESRKKWPSDLNIDFAEFSYQYRYGDPRIALELLPKIMDSSDASMAPYRKVLAARVDPTPAKIDEAIAALNTNSSNNPRAQNKMLLALGNFGRVEDVYKLLEDPGFLSFVDRTALFRLEFAGVRSDPRFMQIAARLGLIRYWRETGYWPDFCASEHLRYDCKTEAAKYRH
jgi:tetratricopeptide (TPR) repeat protein